MTISPITQSPIQPQNVAAKPQNVVTKPQTADFLEKFHAQAKNSADMTDTILVPRTIFKGYLGIMTGTVFVTVGSLVSKALPKFSKFLSVTGLLSSLYGTYAFVRPYIIKDTPGVATKKE